jgi:hypothetical protein
LETTAADQDFLVELRRFEPVTRAMLIRVRLTVCRFRADGVFAQLRHYLS